MTAAFPHATILLSEEVLRERLCFNIGGIEPDFPHCFSGTRSMYMQCGACGMLWIRAHATKALLHKNAIIVQHPQKEREDKSFPAILPIQLVGTRTALLRLLETSFGRNRRRRVPREGYINSTSCRVAFVLTNTSASGHIIMCAIVLRFMYLVNLHIFHLHLFTASDA